MTTLRRRTVRTACGLVLLLGWLAPTASAEAATSATSMDQAGPHPHLVQPAGRRCALAERGLGGLSAPARRRRTTRTHDRCRRDVASRRHATSGERGVLRGSSPRMGGGQRLLAHHRCRSDVDTGQRLRIDLRPLLPRREARVGVRQRVGHVLHDRRRTHLDGGRGSRGFHHGIDLVQRPAQWVGPEHRGTGLSLDQRRPKLDAPCGPRWHESADDPVLRPEARMGDRRGRLLPHEEWRADVDASHDPVRDVGIWSPVLRSTPWCGGRRDRQHPAHGGRRPDVEDDCAAGQWAAPVGRRIRRAGYALPGRRQWGDLTVDRRRSHLELDPERRRRRDAWIRCDRRSNRLGGPGWGRDRLHGERRRAMGSRVRPGVRRLRPRDGSRVCRPVEGLGGRGKRPARRQPRRHLALG